MDATQVKCLTEAYSEVYRSSEDDYQELYESIVQLCIVENCFDTLEECQEFSELLISQDLVEEFIVESYGIDDLNVLSESVESYLGESRGAALRSVINALSKAGRVKAGLKPATALGKKPESIVRGAAASTTIRSARAAKNVPTPQPQAGRYLARQEFKRGIEKATKTQALPSAGQSTAGSVKAVTQRGTTRHNQAVAAAQQKVSQAATVAKAFMKTLKQSAAKEKLATAAKGTTGTGVRVGQPGVTRTPAQVKSTTMKDPYPKTLQKPAPRPKFGKQTDIGGPDKPTKYQQLTTPKSTPAPAPQKDVLKFKVEPPKPAKMSGGKKALIGAAGAAAGAELLRRAATDTADKKSKKLDPSASVNKYNTMDPDGKIRSRLKVGPKIVGPKKVGTVAQAFDREFKSARTAGKSEFEFQGKKYTTKLRNEEVDTFDMVADMLLSEGYVNNYEDALIMMTALDESAIAKLVSGAIKNVIKTGGSKLTKTKLPPKMDPALKAVKDMVKKQYGAGSLIGTPEQRYASAARKAELKRNPPQKPKPRDPFPGDVYSKSDFGIRGYRSGD